MRHVPAVIVLCAAWAAMRGAGAQAPAVDAVYLNGKIVTVDDTFSIREAIAVAGDRIVATGSDAEIRALASADATVRDLGGHTVIPGLIDNHNHVIRATEYWPNEARLDGVTRRAEVLERLATKDASLPRGEWLMTLGGWSESQFVDRRDDFTLAELDAISRERPIFVQSVYDHAYGNSAWFRAMGIPLTGGAATGSDAGLAAYAVRDARGRITGRLDGGFPMIALAIDRFPPVGADKQGAAIEAALGYLASLGLTAIYDPGGLGIKPESYGRIRGLVANGGLPVRIFHTLSAGVPATPETADALIARLATDRPFQGDDAFDMIGMGEIWYGPFHWDNELAPTAPSAADTAVARRILSAAAAAAWPVQTHSMQPETIGRLLDLIEALNTEHPVKPLRWSIAHADNIGADELVRARALGIGLQIRSTSVLGNRSQIVARFGADATAQMPPLRRVADSGVPFGLGTDGTKAGQINPFVTLWWAVTGHALDGERILAQTLTREEALIAHTRTNAYLLFEEQNLGALKPGLLADMLVLDRDYLTVPAESIKDLKPLATIVGGRVVFGRL